MSREPKAGQWEDVTPLAWSGNTPRTRRSSRTPPAGLRDRGLDVTRPTLVVIDGAMTLAEVTTTWRDHLDLHTVKSYTQDVCTN